MSAAAASASSRDARVAASCGALLERELHGVPQRQGVGGRGLLPRSRSGGREARGDDRQSRRPAGTRDDDGHSWWSASEGLRLDAR